MDNNEKVSYEKLVDQYIEDSKLPDLMESYTKQLILNQPDDPVQFLIDLINSKRSQRVVFITGGSQLQRNEIVDGVSRHFNYHVITLGDDEHIKTLKTELINEQAKQALKKVDSHFRGVIFSGYPFNFETAIFAQQNGLLAERVFLLKNSKADAFELCTAQFQGDTETAQRAVTRDKLNNKEIKQMYAGFIDCFKLSKMSKQAVIDNMKSILKIKDKVITPLRSPRILIMRPPHLRIKARSLQKALCQNYGFNEICTFDLLDWHIRQKTAIGRFIHQALSNKKQIPDDIIVGLLRAKMLSTSSKQRGYVTEGFPRTKSQLQAISNYAIKPDLIIIIDSDEDIMLNAYKALQVDQTTGSYYEKKAIAPASKEGIIKEQNLVQNTVDEAQWQSEVNEYKSLVVEAQRVFGNHAQTFKVKRESEKDILAQIELLLSNQKVYS